MNTLIAFLIRLLELMFVVGGIGCICSVIPVTAHRLFMVLFEEDSPSAEPSPTQPMMSPESPSFTPAVPEPGN
jgi:hypothetical protein